MNDDHGGCRSDWGPGKADGRSRCQAAWQRTLGLTAIGVSAPFDGATNEVRAGAQIQLGFELLAIGIDRLRAQTELLRDLPGAKSVADQSKHFDFAVTERVDREAL